MFSSLEALDAEDAPSAAPVVRQGAFQPKAKPRARKGSAAAGRKPSSFPSAPASTTNQEADVHETDLTGGGKPSVEVARSPSITVFESQGRNSPVKVAEVSDSPIQVVSEAQNLVTSHGEDPSTGSNGSAQALWGGDVMGSLTTVNGLSAFEELLASHTFKPVQSARKKHEPRRCQSHCQKHKEGASPELARVEESRQQFLHQSDVQEPFTAGFQQPQFEIVTRTQSERLDESHMEVIEEPEIRHGRDARGGIPASGGPPVETNPEPVKRKKRRGAHQENASFNTDSNLLSKDTSKPPKKSANFAVSVSACASEAVQIAEEAKDSKEAPEEALAETLKPVKGKKKRGGNQAKEVSDGEKILSNTAGMTASKKSKKSKQAAICAESVSLSVSLPGAEAANENGGTVESVQKALLSTSSKTTKRKKRTSNDCEEQDTAEKVSSDVALASPSREAAKRTRRKPARFNDGADDDLIRVSIDVSSEPLKENKRLGSQSIVGDGGAENDFLITFVQEKKLKKSNTASFNATAAQPATDIGIRENATGKSAPPATEEGQRKKFRKTLPSRRRVERRAMNPANPDLDPKKMTMKDIIRLAEAKEKLVKNDNTKKAKDEKQARTTNEIAKEDESSERTCLAPQVQFVDGRIVINEESLTVRAHPKDDIRTYKRVEETHSKLNYHSYLKRTPKIKWRKDETDLFYEALREFGTNFSMIQHLFPGRTRKQVLLKYKKEEKSCPLRISEAMRLKPCETSHFLEVMSSMNLLPSETPDAIESDSCFSFDTASCREAIVGDDSSVAARRPRCLENDGAKVEEPPTPRKDEERQDNNGGDPCEPGASTSRKPEDNQSQDASKSEEKPAESPIKASSPRKKKSLFSYQTVTLKI